MSGLGTPITIRAEAPGDEEAIFTLTWAAFKGMPFSGGTEPYIIDKLPSGEVRYPPAFG